MWNLLIAYGVAWLVMQDMLQQLPTRADDVAPTSSGEALSELATKRLTSGTLENCFWVANVPKSTLKPLFFRCRTRSTQQ